MPLIRADEAKQETWESPAIGISYGINFGDAGGLTQFGVFVETLPPGSRSSVKHWHANEDEFVYLLSGTVELHEGDSVEVMQPGDGACFPAGAPEGHCLVNSGTAEARYLVVGTRAARDRVTYPDDDCVLDFDREAGTRVWTTHDGQPRNSPYK